MHGKVPEDLLSQFGILEKKLMHKYCKFDCLVHKMLFIRQLKPSPNHCNQIQFMLKYLCNFAFIIMLI